MIAWSHDRSIAQGTSPGGPPRGTTRPPGPSAPTADGKNVHRARLEKVDIVCVCLNMSVG